MGACNTINEKENIRRNQISNKYNKIPDFFLPQNLVTKGKIENKYIITKNI